MPTGLPVMKPGYRPPWMVSNSSSIQSMCCALVMTSGAGTSLTGPTFLASWRTQPRQICSCSRALRLCGIADHAALAAAERDVHDRALPGHPHGEGAHGVERLLRVEADAALGRAAGVVVLHAEAAEHLHVAVVHAHRDRELVLAQREAQQLARGRVEVEDVGDLVELGLRHLERIECLAAHR